MSEQQPATKQDLADLETRLTAAVADTERRLQAALGANLAGVEATLSAAFTEKLRDAETKLLGAFFAYQEHDRIQFQHLKADTGNATRAAELRIDNIEQRLLEVERRLLSGPPH
jgi:hypothetical protein